MADSVFKKIISTFFSRVFIAGSSLIIAVLLSNFLGAAGRGDQSLIITSITFIIVVTGIIGSSSIGYLLPRFPFMALIIPSYLWVMVVAAASFFLVPLLKLVPEMYNQHVCLLSLMLGIMNINSAALVSKQRINAANFLGILQSLVIILTLVVTFVFLHHKELQSYILALYAGYGISMLISFLMLKPYFTGVTSDIMRHALQAIKKLTVLGMYNQIAVFTQLLSFRLSYYILNANAGKEAVGIYSNAVSIAESVWLIGRSIATVQHSKIVNCTDNLISLKLTKRMNRLNTLISVAMVFIMIFIPGSWYVWIFGDEFININHIILTLAPGIIFFGIALVLGYYFSSTGRHYVNAIASTAGLVVTVVLGFIFIPVYHNYGAGIVASLSYGVTALVVVFFFIRERKILQASEKK